MDAFLGCYTPNLVSLAPSGLSRFKTKQKRGGRGLSLMLQDMHERFLNDKGGIDLPSPSMQVAVRYDLPLSPFQTDELEVSRRLLSSLA